MLQSRVPTADNGILHKMGLAEIFDKKFLQ